MLNSSPGQEQGKAAPKVGSLQWYLDQRAGDRAELRAANQKARSSTRRIANRIGFDAPDITAGHPRTQRAADDRAPVWVVVGAILVCSILVLLIELGPRLLQHWGAWFYQTHILHAEL
jgi:hypothetical protein